MDSFIKKYYPNYYHRYKTFPHMIQKIDFFKYAVLNIEGGFYIDMDVECIKPIKLPKKYSNSDFIASRNPTMMHENLILNGMTEFYNNAVLYSVPDFPILKSLIKHAFGYDCSKIDKTECVFFTTGPIIYSRIVNNFKSLNITIIPSSYFEPVWMPKYNTIDSYLNKCNKHQIGEHKFDASWSENKPLLKCIFIIYIHIRYILPFIMAYCYYNYNKIFRGSILLYAIAVVISKLYIYYKIQM